MTRRRRALVVAAALALAFPANAAAAPGDFTYDLDWAGDATIGFGGWQAVEVDPDPAGEPGSPVPLEPPYYAAHHGTKGRGIELEPAVAANGTRDRVYPNYNPTDQSGGPRINDELLAPGTTAITAVTAQDIDFLNDSEGQILRIGIHNAGGANIPTSAFGFDIGSPAPGPFVPGISYTGIGPLALSYPYDAANPGKRVQVSLRTICAPPGSCPTVHFDGPSAIPGSSARFGTLRISLFDPEPPSGALTGTLAAAGGWSRGRGTLTGTVTGDDPGSGVKRVSATRSTNGGPPVTVLDSAAGCDLTHQQTPAGDPGRICPMTFADSFAQSTGALADGVTRYDANVRDLSDRVASSTAFLRVDRRKPAAAVGGAVTRLSRDWLNLRGPVSSVLHARDATSGVRSIRLLARTSRGQVVLGRRDVCDATTLGPADSCPLDAAVPMTFDASALPDGVVTLVADASDAAGNASPVARGPALRLDRRAPSRPGALKVVAGGARASVRWASSRDPARGAGGVGYALTFTAGAGRTVQGIATGPSLGLSARRTGDGLELLAQSDGGPLGDWQPAPRSMTLRAGELRGTAGTLTVCASDRVGNRSSCRTGSVKLVARSASKRRGRPASRKRAPDSVLRLARRFSPYVFLDKSEKYNILDVDDFFARDEATLCLDTGCRDTRRIDEGSDLKRFSPRGGHLQFDPERHGGASRIYAHSLISRSRRYRFIDYWWFQRNNIYKNTRLDRHHGDWEGMYVAVPNTPHPNTVSYVGIAAHEATYNYFPSVLRCANPGARKVHETHELACDRSKTHVNIYSAEGSHASYPRRCSPDVTRLPPRFTCRQTAIKKREKKTGIVVTLRLPEGGFSGSQPWKGNYRSKSGSVKLFGSWADWRGNWARPGEGIGGGGVKSPGQQPRFQDPTRVTLCTDRWSEKGDNNVYNCSSGRAESSATVPRARSAAAPAEAVTPPLCQAWFGPEVTAAACDPVMLQAALDAGTVGEEAGSAAITGSGVDSASAAGLAQAVGDPVMPGRPLALTGVLPPTATLQVRGAGPDGEEVESRFVDLGLDRGGTFTVTASAVGQGVALQGTRPDGTTGPPAETNVPVDSPARPVEQLSATRQGRIVRVRFLPHEDRQTVDLLDKRGALVRSAQLSSTAGTVRTVTIVAPLRATRVRVVGLDDVGQASEAVRARIVG